jgi:hypothetical protein
MAVYLERQRLIWTVTCRVPADVRSRNGRKASKASKLPRVHPGRFIRHAFTAPIVYSGSWHPELSPQCPFRVITKGCASTGPTLAPCRVRTM